MLVKLNVVNTSHVIKYKSRITHCDDGLSLLDYILSLKLDDASTIKFDDIAEVLVGAGSFVDSSAFDKESLEFVTISELKKSMSAGMIYL